MEKLFELAIAIGMAVFAVRVAFEGMRRLEIGEKGHAFTILSLSAAILAVQVAVILSAFQPSSVGAFAGEIRAAAQSVAPAEANDSVPAAALEKSTKRSHHHQRPAVSADD
jgi:hypothetical protein